MRSHSRVWANEKAFVDEAVSVLAPFFKAKLTGAAVKQAAE